MSGDLKILDGVDLSSGGTVFWRYYYDDGSYGEMAFGIDPALVTEDWKRFYVTKTIVVPDGKTLKPSSAQISVAIGNAIGGVAFRNLKLEKGSTPTNWTPAIEDVSESIASIDEVANDAQSTANNNADRITQAESIIQQLSDSIIMLVTDSNGESLMTQTDTGWTFSTASIQDTVDTTSANLDALISEVGDVNSAVGVLQQAVEDLGILNEYVKITTYEDEPCIELGETDSDFKLLITNTRIMFMEGTGVPAYITNQALHIKKAVVEEELQQGEFVWKARANGNLGLIWKGVTS